jgi:NAD(P)-dependent dehydrogenase (short-subunit alcohol dehydrogenase family)
MRRALPIAAALGAAAAGAVWLRRRQLPPPPGVVLITGGSRGLGLVLAREYLRAGARVAICARDEEELARAKRKLDAEHGERVLALRCDLSDPAQVAGMLAAVRMQWGGIDVVVNNAGVISVGPLEHMTQADFDEAMRVHFWAPLRVVDAVLPEMRERGSGRIVNIASLAGLIPVPHMLPYAASKAALVSWSDGLHTELAPHGVLVTTVCPGLVRTGSPRHAKFKGRHRDEHAWFSIADSLPLLSAGAERAARKIMRASQLGRARVVMPGYTRVPPALYAAFPDLALAALSLANRFLPDPGGIGDEARPGSQSESPASPSWITTLSDRAAQRNNEE